MYEEEIRKQLTGKKLVMGRDEVIKGIHKGIIGKVFIASNCPGDLKKDLDKYSAMSGFELLDTKVPNHELGTVCKKPFAIAILGLKK